MAFRELNYQTRALDVLDAFLAALSDEKVNADQLEVIRAAHPGVEFPIPDFPAKAWERMKDEGRLPQSRSHFPYSPRKAGNGQPVPNATLKVPTGGGKTYLACAAISRIFGRYLSTNTGFVLWIVPNEAIYTQTLKHLRDRQHPYRQTLDRVAAGRVIIMEKGDPFSRANVDANLCVMVLMLQSSNRENQESLRLFRDRGDVHGFTPSEGEQAAHKALLNAVPNLSIYDLAGSGPAWPMVKDSVGNALRIIRPVVIMDEGHRAISDLAFRTLYDFNPLFVLELSATPRDVATQAATAARPASPERKANVLVEITGRELEQEGMIKMPLNIVPMADDSWKGTVRAALDKLNALDAAAKAYRSDGGYYIRPILLVQAERTGAEQRDSGYIHADDVKAWLLAAGLDEAEVALKTAETNDLDKPENRDLLSPMCRVRVIITKAALAEGWDCPIAYVLCSLAATGNESAMTQLVGRILRQPNAVRTEVDDRATGVSLDEAYVFTHRAETAAVVAAIKKGLSSDGLSDLVQDVKLSNRGATSVAKRQIQRRDSFRTTDIALPQVLWIEPGRDARLLDAENDLFPAIDWAACDLESFANALPEGAHAAETQVVRLRTGEDADFVTEDAVAVEEARCFNAPHAVRMVNDIVPNPYVARALVQQVLDRLTGRGFASDMIGRMSGFIIDELRKVLSRWREEQAAAVFRERLNNGQIEFRVRGDGGDWTAPDHIWTAAAEAAPQVLSGTGGALGRSLFLPVYASDLNDDEKQVAVYLDAQAVIKWWHRNGTDRGSYALRGWRRGNVYPDFIFAALRDESGERIVAVESKGDQLAGNLDTEYKRELLEMLSKKFGKAAAAKAGELPMGAKNVEYEAAVVLFSDWKAKLPALITG
ncbi:DEAD/DEAH box helicase family protein [Sphingomonas sp. LY29]|uniref:DEAD/DEAH box helicase n=1 Tax=Sphingomonas sp. LY29 TaxID=3095341 RepID=UPI002D77F612|nr:DEAD/DEAH box helicase family protein [Sphingomonas sp. LY29]WRP25153.1 DEAD/DEAH box helicase family protein [Sphingomonas sp. LY29]